MKRGCKHSPEAKRILAMKSRIITTASWADSNSGLRNRKSFKGKTYKEIYGSERAKELIEIQRQKTKEQWDMMTDAEREMRSQKAKQRWERMTEEEREKARERGRENARKAWRIPGRANAMLLRQRLNKKPSIPETQFMDRLYKEFPNIWKYVGDGQVWIAGANPDFLNVNGQKLLIETYTPYFKVKDYGSIEAYIEKRGSHFLAYGFKTLF